jgi:cell division protein ZipA
MDWQIRIALAIVGLVLIGYIFYDFSKKKKLQKDNQKLKRQFSNINDQVDSTGFDPSGVGTARQVNGELADDTAKKTAPPTGQSVDSFLANNEQARQQSTTNNRINEPQPENKDFFQSEKNSDELNESESKIEPEIVFSLILQASNGQTFKGKDFLPIFLSQGLRHGEMGIFHRHKNAGANPGPVLFSLANAISPGTFSINNLESFETPAFALFMTLPGPDDAQVAYDVMVKTVRLLKTELGGEILDESKAKYSEQTHSHRLDTIQKYSRKLN